MQKTPKHFRSYSVKRINNLPNSFYNLYAQVADAINDAAQYPDLKAHMLTLVKINEQLYDMQQSVESVVRSIKPSAERSRVVYNLDSEAADAEFADQFLTSLNAS